MQSARVSARSLKSPFAENITMFTSVLKKIVIAIGALIAIAILSGAAFERVSRERALRKYPAPGRLVDIGGRRIQIDCRGDGSPTVVFESGLDVNGSLSWSAVHDSIAATTRACAYSRAGVMWSDPSDRPFDSDSAATDLHAALVGSGERGPWIMVGHSLGGPYIVAFTSRYPDEVVGLVMVDCAHPDQFEKYQTATGKSLKPSPAQVQMAKRLAWTGVVRLFPAGLDGAPQAFLPLSVTGLADETAAVTETLARERHQASLGDRPLVVLAAGRGASPEELELMKITPEQGARVQAAHQGLSRDMATWSTRGRYRLVPGASHYIQRDRPDAVIGAVREVMGYVIAHDTSPRRR
jgi:pimeloyl-ACP methyl ester carboxylesterase